MDIFTKQDRERSVVGRGSTFFSVIIWENIFQNNWRKMLAVLICVRNTKLIILGKYDFEINIILLHQEELDDGVRELCHISLQSFIYFRL